MRYKFCLLLFTTIVSFSFGSENLVVDAHGDYCIGLKQARMKAESVAQKEFGICALGEPFEYSDPFGSRVAYMFPVKLNSQTYYPPQDNWQEKNLPQGRPRRKIVGTRHAVSLPGVLRGLSGEDWKDGYGRILISAKSYLTPVLEICAAAPHELSRVDKLREIIGREQGLSEPVLDRIYYMPFGLRLFRFTDNDRSFLIDPFTLDVISAEEFDEFVEMLRNPENAIDERKSPEQFVNRWSLIPDETMDDYLIPGYEYVPYYDWEYGCSATAGAMLFGYYENFCGIGRLVTKFFAHNDHKYAEINYHVADLQQHVAGCMGTDTVYIPPYDNYYGGTSWGAIERGFLRIAEEMEIDFSVTSYPTASYTDLTSYLSMGYPTLISLCWERPTRAACHSMLAVGYGSGEQLFLHNTWDNLLDERWSWNHCTIVGYDSYTETNYTFGELFHRCVDMAFPTSVIETHDLTLLSPCHGSGLDVEPYAGDPGYMPEYSHGDEMSITWFGADTLLPLIIQLSTDDGVTFEELGFVPFPDSIGEYIWSIPADFLVNTGRIRILQFDDGFPVSADGSFRSFSIGPMDGCFLPDAYENGDTKETASWIGSQTFYTTCTFHRDDDVDWFGFFGAPHQSFNFSIGSLASPVVTLMRDNLDTIYHEDGCGDVVNFDWTPDAPDIYYLAFHRSDSTPDEGCYLINISYEINDSISCFAPDDYENDDISIYATTLELSDNMQMQRHTIYPVDEYDYYRIYLEAGENFWISTSTSEDVQLQATLYNSFFEYENFSTSAYGYNFLLQHSAIETDTYYLEVYCDTSPPVTRQLCYDIYYRRDLRRFELQVPSLDTAVVGRFYSFMPYFRYETEEFPYEFYNYPDWMTVDDTIINGIPPIGDTTYHFSIRLDYGVGFEAYTESATVALYVWDCPDLADEFIDTVAWGEFYVLHPELPNAHLLLLESSWLTCDDSIYGIVPDSLAIFYFYLISYTPLCSDTQIVTLYGYDSGISESKIPKSFSLDSPQPNPTNATVKISYSLPSAGTVTMSIIDVSGRLMIGKVFHASHAGYFTKTLNLSEFTSGIYMLKLSFNGEDRYRKLTLVK